MSTNDRLAPIEGLDLAAYVAVCRSLVRRGGDPATRRDEVLRELGLDAGRWAACRAGWSSRLRDEPEVRAEFRRLYAEATGTASGIE